MIKELRLSGFKAFARPQIVPFGQITLIFGANSSGKSSILQSILLLKQSIEEAGESSTVVMPRGSLVNLGTFSDMLHRGHSPGEIEIGVRWSKARWSPMSLNDVPLEPPKIPIQDPWFQLAIGASRGGNIRLKRFSFGSGEFSDPFALAEPMPGRRSLRGLTKGSRFRLRDLCQESDLAEFVYQTFRDGVARAKYRHEFRLANGPTLIHSNLGAEETQQVQTRFSARLSREAQALSRLDSLTRERFFAELKLIAEQEIIFVRHYLPWLWQEHRDERTVPRTEQDDPLAEDLILRQLDSLPYSVRIKTIGASSVAASLGRGLAEELSVLRYIGALRDQPDRYALPNGGAVSDVGRRGQFTADLLLSRTDVRGAVNAALSSLGVNYNVEAVGFGKKSTKDLQLLRLRDRESGLLVSPLDVGVGVSQVLPIVVQSLATKSGIIVIEEPESHLHPRLQAELGNLFADGVRENNNQYIVETHSEHLILRLQRLVREKKLRADQVRVLYVKKASSSAEIFDLKMDENGSFVSDWPDGFFPERLAEL
jgi:ABC-type lipoprotein export system ATPase subunit